MLEQLFSLVRNMEMEKRKAAETKTNCNIIKFNKEPNPNLSFPNDWKKKITWKKKNHDSTLIFLLFFHHMSCLLERKSQEEGPQGNNSLSFLENPGKKWRGSRCAVRLLQNRAVRRHAVLPFAVGEFYSCLCGQHRVEELGTWCFMLTL